MIKEICIIFSESCSCTGYGFIIYCISRLSIVGLKYDIATLDNIHTTILIGHCTENDEHFDKCYLEID